MVAQDPAVRHAAAVVRGLAAVAGLGPQQRRDRTAVARAEQRRRLEMEVDPDGVLDPAELDYQVRAAIRLKMARMALASAQARAARRADREAADLDAIIAAGAA